MVFVVIEGFSGTGKTTLSKGLERRGWLRLTESAHAVPAEVPLGDKADTFADFSLTGASLEYSSVIAGSRDKRSIVADGYLLSDLSYARIRYDMGKSKAFPALFDLVKGILSDEKIRPDLYVLLKAERETIDQRQGRKSARERNLNGYFQTRYYTAIEELHRGLGQTDVEEVHTDTDLSETLERLVGLLRRRGLLGD